MVEIGHLQSGATVLGEPRRCSGTVSLCIHLPCGVVFDDERTVGASLLVAETLNRGTIELPAKEFRARFERRGIHYFVGGGFEKSVIRIDCMLAHLEEAIALFATALSQPRLSDPRTLEEGKRMLINDIRARADDPGAVAAHRLGELFFTAPYSRPRDGTEDGLMRSTQEVVQAEFNLALAGSSVIVAWCGDCDQRSMLDLLSKYLDFLKPIERSTPRCFAVNTQELKPIHIERPTEQRSVIACFESAPLLDSAYFPAKIASICLGGGLFSRLFNELREKRGLVYDIGCSHSSNRDRGWMAISFACAPDKFSEALNLAKQVVCNFVPTTTELGRCQRQVRLSLASGDEARGSRCETLASEWAYHGRVRTETELVAAVNQVDEAAIAKMWEVYPPFRNAVEVSVGGEG